MVTLVGEWGLPEACRHNPCSVCPVTNTLLEFLAYAAYFRNQALVRTFRKCSGNALAAVLPEGAQGKGRRGRRRRGRAGKGAAGSGRWRKQPAHIIGRTCHQHLLIFSPDGLPCYLGVRGIQEYREAFW